MRIGIAQINSTVGDLRGNFEKILAAYERLAAASAELILAPELAITGYPPQDLVFKSRFVPQNLEALERLHQCLGAVPLLVGYVDHNHGRGKPFFNAAALLQAVARTFAQPVERPAGARHPHDRHLQAAAPDQRLQRRKDLLVSQVACGAEENEGI